MIIITSRLYSGIDLHRIQRVAFSEIGATLSRLIHRSPPFFRPLPSTDVHSIQSNNNSASRLHRTNYSPLALNLVIASSEPRIRERISIFIARDNNYSLSDTLFLWCDWRFVRIFTKYLSYIIIRIKYKSYRCYCTATKPTAYSAINILQYLVMIRG